MIPVDRIDIFLPEILNVKSAVMIFKRILSFL